MGDSDSDYNVEVWRIKRLIKFLTTAKGNGSMVSLIVPPKDQIALIQKKLTEEYGTASNIKSRVNRLSVLSAITSVQQKLKMYNKVPTNGLCIFTGEIVTEEGKEKKLNIDFEPFRPVTSSLYACENKFVVGPLEEILEAESTYGFIVMDGSQSLFGTVSGNHREIINKFSVDLPKKHGRGGQSALRFARLRLEKRHNYVRKVAETAVQCFIQNDKPTVAGLVLAGAADFKNELHASDMFDPRLQNIVLAVVDVSYGGENGFNQAIELSADTLANVKFVQEKKLISKFFDEISQDTGKYVFGIKDTLNGLEMGAVEILMVFENLDCHRFVLRNSQTAEEIVKNLNAAQEADQKEFHDRETGAELEVIERMPMLEWLASNYKKFGCVLEFVTDRSQEGSQFCKGFGGIGGILRYQVELDTNYDDLDAEDQDVWSDDDWI
eukprot:TRINITY_DN24118_c0_g1_i3.p1 TRINITY_DN24118_c0_g1~~TRINITY_DN24118_c0_g1_i3.p1  ORF type:complete len:466 (+),score=80.13 TRINITY_DN24118_c0_g1_i3:85-1398(+)